MRCIQEKKEIQYGGEKKENRLAVTEPQIKGKKKYRNADSSDGKKRLKRCERNRLGWEV